MSLFKKLIHYYLYFPISKILSLLDFIANWKDKRDTKKNFLSNGIGMDEDIIDLCDQVGRNIQPKLTNLKTIKHESKKDINSILCSFTPPVLTDQFPQRLQDFCREKAPSESTDAYFLAVIPNDIYDPEKNFEETVKSCDKYQKFNIMMSAQGMENFGLRAKKVGKPLAKKGIITIIHCSPFYGLRKSGKNKHGHVLDSLGEFMALGGMSVTEIQAIAYYLHELIEPKLCISGMSMGGMLSSRAFIHMKIRCSHAALFTSYTGHEVWMDGLQKSRWSFDDVKSNPGGEKYPTRESMRPLFQRVFGIDSEPAPQNRKLSVQVSCVDD